MNYVATTKRLAQFGSRPRRGFLLMSVLVCLTLAMVIMGAAIKTISTERQQLRAEHHRMQAEYLARAGLDRGLAQLAANQNYAGETWHVAAEALGGHAGANITITVQPVPGARRIRAVADFPENEASRARRTAETQISLPSSGEAP